MNKIVLISCLFLALLTAAEWTGCTITDDLTNSTIRTAFTNYSWCHSSNDFIGPHSFVTFSIYDNGRPHNITGTVSGPANDTYHTLCRYRDLDDPLSWLCKQFTALTPLGVPVIDEDILHHFNFTKIPSGIPKLRRTVLVLADVNNHIHLFDPNLERIVYRSDGQAHSLTIPVNGTIELRRNLTSLINHTWVDPSFIEQIDTVEVFGLAYIITATKQSLKVWRVQASLPSYDGHDLNDVPVDQLPSDIRKRQQFKDKLPQWDPSKISFDDSLDLSQCVSSAILSPYREMHIAKTKVYRNTIYDAEGTILIVGLLRDVDGDDKMSTIEWSELGFQHVPALNTTNPVCTEVVPGGSWIWKISRQNSNGPLRFSLSVQGGVRNVTGWSLGICDIWVDGRYIVHLYDNHNVWSVPLNDHNTKPVSKPFNGTWSGGRDRFISLTPENVMTTTKNGKVITSVAGFGSCYTPTEKNSQSMWVTVGVNVTNNATANSGMIYNVPFPELSDHHFGCPGDTKLIAGPEPACLDLWSRCTMGQIYLNATCVDRSPYVRGLDVPTPVNDVQPRPRTEAITIINADDTVERITTEHHTVIFFLWTERCLRTRFCPREW